MLPACFERTDVSNPSLVGMGSPLTFWYSLVQKMYNTCCFVFNGKGFSTTRSVPSGVREERKTVCFESHFAQLIKSINCGNCIPKLYEVVADILSFVSVLEFVSFSWISREKNV